MHKSKRWVVAVVFIAGLCTQGLGQEPVDALADARKKFDAGEYRPALQTIAVELSRRPLSNPRETTVSPQRYELLMLRGECLLRIDQRASAGDAFTQAEKSAGTPQEFALARANTILLKASPNNKYTPRGRSNSTAPIDILDMNLRKQAFQAIKDERLDALEPRLNRAKTGTTLPPMFEVLDPLLDIAALEFAANGSAIQTRVTLQDLGTHARDLINAELRRLAARLNALEDASNSVIGVNVGYIGRRGLYSNEAQEVREHVAYLEQIEKTARDVRQRAQKLGFEAEAWAPIVADSADLADRAAAMLNIVP